MRNLIILNERIDALPKGSYAAFTIDSVEERFFALNTQGRVVCVVDGEVVWEVFLNYSIKDDWHWCQYNQELEAVVCASQSGCLAVISVNDKSIELIGHFDAGICGVAWNTTEDQVAIVTGDGNFLTMSTNWDVLHECPLNVPSLAGSTVEMAWRADGKFLVMNGLFEAKQNQILVWEFNNATWYLHAKGRYEDSRPLTDLQQSVTWCPNHTLITSSQIFKKQLHVVFFERNGLRHGEFVVNATAVSHVQWNSLSDVLAVACRRESGDVTIQLWTRNNYHWYLKQERLLSAPIASMQWDPESPYKLHVFTCSGEYHNYTITTKVHTSANATVAVIDGCNLKLTHFSQAMIPPPMCAATHTLSSPINVITFVNEAIILVTANGSWYLLDTNSPKPILWKGVPMAMKMQAVAYTGKVLRGIPEGKNSTFIEMDFDLNKATITTMKDQSSPYTVEALSLDGNGLQFGNGELINHDEVHPLYSEWIQLEDLLIGKSNSKLYINTHLLHSSVASFHVSHGYLLLTTLGSQSELRMHKLMDLVMEDYEKVHTQPVERGAKLVTTVESGSEVILQMPRGNIEIVSPRPLLLTLVQHHVQAIKYGPALELCRKHRIDMNILVDINPTAFLENLGRLIEDIPERLRSDRLSLFMTNLHPINVCETKYTIDYVSAPENFDKVDEVCKAFRNLLMALDPIKYLLPLLTCEAKFGLIESALQRLNQPALINQGLVEKGLQHLIFLVDVEVLYDYALGLYDMKLTRLVAGHTERDPKEYLPKLAAFEDLATSHSPSYMKYTIDLELTRYAKALQHLANDTKYNEQSLALIKEHHLYDEGLKFFSKTSPLHNEIIVAYGHHLLATGDSSLAGYTFLSAKPQALSPAVDAFRKALNWKMAMNIASLIPSYDVVSLGYELAEELLNAMGTQRNPKAAAELYVKYCQDIDEGVATLIQAREWEDALQRALLHKRKDLIQTEVEPLVIQAGEDMLEDIAQRQKTYSKHWKRLTNLREQIRLFRLHGIDGKADDRNTLDDGASSAASAFSQSSMSSIGSHNSNRDIKFASLTAFETNSHHHNATASPFYAAMSATVDAPTAKKKMPRRFRRSKIQEGSAEEDAYVEKCLREQMPSREFLADLKKLLAMLAYFNKVRQIQSIQVKLDAFMDHIAAHLPPAPVHV
ncbi:RNA polymerase II elongator complex subunit [Thraustotheca clavata]|uniref:Elongator complex protein 1 n=1 Tax=Thraustotheca clavata TaxID=74557 RepID=A0A1W0A3B7_9STRA|nr:RNA polymerase II elongator complex subunit [Thraustotheca clavata]